MESQTMRKDWAESWCPIADSTWSFPERMKICTQLLYIPYTRYVINMKPYSIRRMWFLVVHCACPRTDIITICSTQ